MNDGQKRPRSSCSRCPCRGVVCGVSDRSVPQRPSKSRAGGFGVSRDAHIDCRQKTADDLSYRFWVWDGVVVDYRTSSSALFRVVPGELVIHITSGDYPENRLAWTNGVLIGSTNLTAQSGNSIHIWIGISPDYGKRYPSSVGPMLEYFLIKTLAYRTTRRHVDGDTITPISFRERKTYVFSAQKQ